MAANAARLPLLRVASNAHRFLPPAATGRIAREAVVASCALALAGVVGNVTIPSHLASADPDPDPTGATSLWSSGGVGLLEDPRGLSTAEAAALVATDPWARHWLQVCARRPAGGNCGVCLPCQVTLTHLWLAGVAAANLTSFDHGPDPAIVRALDPRFTAAGVDHRAMVGALIRLAEGSESGRATVPSDDRLLAAALADAWTALLGRAEPATPAPALSA